MLALILETKGTYIMRAGGLAGTRSYQQFSRIRLPRLRHLM
jgi:hypothetical protein